jgi:membrane protein YqaA with SNARE-associated domain
MVNSSSFTLRSTSLLKIAFQFVALALLIAGAFWLTRYIAGDGAAVAQLVGNYGLLAIFLISLASGFNLVVPLPAIVFLPIFTELGYSLPLLIAIITLGMTFGDSIAFWVGRAGKDVLHGTRAESIISRFESAREKHPLAPLLLLVPYVAFVPLPNEILVLPLSFIGYPFRFIFPTLLVGNAVFNTLSALGIAGLFSLFG